MLVLRERGVLNIHHAGARSAGPLISPAKAPVCHVPAPCRNLVNETLGSGAGRSEKAARNKRVRGDVEQNDHSTAATTSA